MLADLSMWETLLKPRDSTWGTVNLPLPTCLVSIDFLIRIPVTVRPASSGLGLGLFYTPSTPVSLPPGTFVSLYAGEVLTSPQARVRWSEKASGASGQGNYILSLRLPDRVLHIDPRHIGNVGRFLNHSCEPNCVIHVVRWGGGPGWPRAAIFVSHPITE